MLHFRVWLLAGLPLLFAGCQFPLFRDRISSITSRKDSPTKIEQVQDERNRQIRPVSAEVPVETSAQQQIYQLLSRGNLELSSGRLPDAQIYFRQALDIDPTNFHAHHMLGRIGDQTQQFEEAEGHYLAALSSNPGDPNLLSDMGYSYLLQGAYSYANTYLRRALNSRPDHVMARRNLAALSAYQGDYQTALAWLRQVGTEQQAQSTLRELVANRPPQLRLKNDPRSQLAPDASEAARELAAQLLKAKEQAAREEWKREMAEWNRERARRVPRPEFDPQARRPMGQGIPNENLHDAMRAVNDEYSRQSQPSDPQPRIIGPPATSQWNDPGPQSMQLAEQMRRQAVEQNRQPDAIYPQGQPEQLTNPIIVPPQGQNPYGPPSQGQSLQQPFSPAMQPGPGYPADHLNQTGFDMRGQVPVQRPQSAMNPQAAFSPQSEYDSRQAYNPQGEFRSQESFRPSEHRVELIPPPADFSHTSGQSVSPSDFPARSGDPYVWHPEQNPQQPLDSADSATTRRALDLGMSIGPGSLFPMGTPSPGQAGPQPGQLGGYQPPGRLPTTGAVPIQTGSGARQSQSPPYQNPQYQPQQQHQVQPHQTQQGPVVPQRRSYEEQARQPNLVPGGVPGYGMNSSPSQPGYVQPYSGQDSTTSPGVVYTDSASGQTRFNTNWQSRQTPSPTFNHSTGQPINPPQHYTQPAPMPESFRTGGALASPTMSPDFARPHYTAPEQQQIQPTAHTTPGVGGMTGAGTPGRSPSAARATLPDFRSSDNPTVNQLRSLHNGQF